MNRREFMGMAGMALFFTWQNPAYGDEADGESTQGCGGMVCVDEGDIVWVDGYSRGECSTFDEKL